MSAELETRIVHFLASELGVREKVETRTSLLASGLVDSAGLVRLAALLERETGRVIPDKDLTPEHFDSIEQILEYLGSR